MYKAGCVAQPFFLFEAFWLNQNKNNKIPNRPDVQNRFCNNTCLFVLLFKKFMRSFQYSSGYWIWCVMSGLYLASVIQYSSSLPDSMEGCSKGIWIMQQMSNTDKVNKIVLRGRCMAIKKGPDDGPLYQIVSWIKYQSLLRRPQLWLLSTLRSWLGAGARHSGFHVQSFLTYAQPPLQRSFR